MLRFQRILSMWLLLLATGVAQAQQASPRHDPVDEQVRRFIEFTRASLRYPEPAARIARSSQVVGKRGDGSPLTVDISLPEARGAAPMPVVLLLHGGLPDEARIAPRTWQVYRDWGAALAASGTAAVMFDHTFGSPQRRLDQALAEIDTVLAWLREHGRSHGLDTRQIDVFAFSAGGLLVPELLSDKRPLPIHGAVLFYPSTRIVPGSPSASLVAPDVGARMDLRAAAAKLSARKIPVLILRAGHDRIPGLLPALDDSIAGLLAADARVQVINVPGVPHGFDALVDSADVRSALTRALAFPKRDAAAAGSPAMSRGPAAIDRPGAGARP